MTPYQIQFLRVRAEHEYASASHPLPSSLPPGSTPAVAASRRTLGELRILRIQRASALGLREYSQTMSWWHRNRATLRVTAGEPVDFPEY